MREFCIVGELGMPNLTKFFHKKIGGPDLRNGRVSAWMCSFFCRCACCRWWHLGRGGLPAPCSPALQNSVDLISLNDHPSASIRMLKMEWRKAMAAEIGTWDQAYVYNTDARHQEWEYICLNLYGTWEIRASF